MEIPFVGHLMIRNNIAAVFFNSQMIEDTKGVTVRAHLHGKLFANNNNRHNMQILDKTGLQSESKILCGTLRVTHDAENWMKSNLGVDMNDLVNPKMSRAYERVQSAKPISRL